RGLAPGRDNRTLAESTVLSFEPVGPGCRYRVDVEAEDGREVLHVETEAARIPIAADVLAPGRQYAWTVHAVDQAGWSLRADSRFSTLSASEAEARAALKAAAGSSNDWNVTALLAEMDRSLGLLTEAQEDVATLRTKPVDPILAEWLRGLESSLKDSGVE